MLPTYFQVAQRSWRLIAAVTFIGALLGASASLFFPRTYTATMSFYISAQTPDNSTSAYQGGLLSQERAISYVQLLESPRTAADVLARIGEVKPLRDLQDEIVASSKVDSVIIDVTVSDRSPELALRIAGAIGESFPDLIAEIERPIRPATAAPVAVRLVQQPLLNTDPAWPPGLAVCSIAGALLGTLGGLLFAIARQSFNTTISNSKQLSELSRAFDLGALPLVSGPSATMKADHAYGEAVRRLRANLTFIRVDSPPQTLIVTSSQPGEGKTTLAHSLADVLARAGSRTLLIDADMRRPTAHKRLGMPRDVGLSTILSGALKVEDATQIVAPNLAFIASGRTPPNPSELLGSERMADLLGATKRLYDFVIIDSPPLLPVADTVSVASNADGVIFLAKYGTTKTTNVETSAASLHAVSANLLGSVLNASPTNPRDYGGYYLPDVRPDEVDAESDTSTVLLKKPAPTPHRRAQ